MASSAGVAIVFSITLIKRSQISLDLGCIEMV